MENTVTRITAGALLLSALAMPSETWSTTIVVKVERNRILLAADTRQTKGRDYTDVCKIEVLGKIGFAAVGNVNYVSDGSADVVRDWDAYEDARTSYQYRPNGLSEIAGDWGQRAMQFYDAFYAVNPHRVKELAGDANLLVEGAFLRWDEGGQPVFFAVKISVEETAQRPIIGTKTPFPPRELLYTSNPFTRSLIEKASDQTSDVFKRWKKGREKFPRPDRDWRWMEFLIRATRDLDHSVGGGVDVLELRPSGHKWLQTSVCKAQ